MTEQQILDLSRHRESEDFSELEKLALDYAVALSETPGVGLLVRPGGSETVLNGPTPSLHASEVVFVEDEALNYS